VTRATLDALGSQIDGTLELIIDDLTEGGKITAPAIVVSGTPRCACPGLRADKAAVYLVPIADRRFLLKKKPIDRGYNVLSSDGSDYLTESKDGGSDWTWQTMVDDIVDTHLGLPTMTLPYTPDGTPEDFAFYGMSAWDALNAVMTTLSCSVVYDLEEDTFSVVEVGAEDGRRDWDADPVPVTFARVSAKARVRFTRVPAPDDGSSPYYTIDKDPPASAGTTATGTVEWLEGGMDALGATGTPTNDAALQTRATEVASKYYQSLLTGTDPLLRRYAGIRTAAGLRPGRRVQAIVWQDLGQGWLTEVYRGPVGRPQRPALPVSPLTASGEVELIRLQAGVIGNTDTGGADTEVTLNGVPVIAYFGWVQESGEIVGPGGPPPDDFTQPCWLVPYYQEAVFGSLPNTSLSAGRAYPGKYTGESATGEIDLRDDGDFGFGDSNMTCLDVEDPDANCQTLSLPVYWFTLAPIAGICDEDGPIWGGMGVG
jgi:hypothetical protein